MPQDPPRSLCVPPRVATAPPALLEVGRGNRGERVGWGPAVKAEHGGMVLLLAGPWRGPRGGGAAHAWQQGAWV